MLKHLTVGDSIGDMFILETFHDKRDGLKCKCRCTICDHEKIVRVRELEYGRGITHDSCNYGKYSFCTDRQFYNLWRGMRERTSPNPNGRYYKDYYSRGITNQYYDDFYGFYVKYYPVFVVFRLQHPNEIISVDRIDNNIGYIDGNIRFATPTMQTRNRRNMRNFYAFSPDGHIYITNNQAQFAINHGFVDPESARKTINHVLNIWNSEKMRFTRNGWTFVFEHDIENFNTVYMYYVQVYANNGIVYSPFIISEMYH